MFLLNDVTVNFEVLSNDNISRFFKIFQDTSSQQAQTERVIAIGSAGNFDLGVWAFDSLCLEELDRICVSHGSQFDFATTEYRFSTWFDGRGRQAGGHQDLAFDIGQRANAFEEDFCVEGDTIETTFDPTPQPIPLGDGSSESP